MAEPYAGCRADGCDHTAGRRRAWCSTCSEWCYPDVACVRGQLSRSQAAYDVRLAELGQVRQQLATVRELHAAVPITTPSQFTAWCHECSVSAPCRTLQALDHDHQEDRPMPHVPDYPTSVRATVVRQALADIGINTDHVSRVDIDLDEITVYGRAVDSEGFGTRTETTTTIRITRPYIEVHSELGITREGEE